VPLSSDFFLSSSAFFLSSSSFFFFSSAFFLSSSSLPIGLALPSRTTARRSGDCLIAANADAGTSAATPSMIGRTLVTRPPLLVTTFASAALLPGAARRMSLPPFANLSSPRTDEAGVADCAVKGAAVGSVVVAACAGTDTRAAVIVRARPVAYAFFALVIIRFLAKSLLVTITSTWRRGTLSTNLMN
jgi:hypothetical protein